MPEPQIFESERMDDLSTNLLGLFMPEDIGFAINKDCSTTFHADWHEGQAGMIPNENQYTYIPQRPRFYINADQLHKAFQHNGASYHFHFVHKPTLCNFWHVCIQVINDEGQCAVSTLASSGKKRRLRIAARAVLLAKVINFDPPRFTPLPPEDYRNDLVCISPI